MTKVLLVNPKLPSLSREGIVIPTGLLWIASYLKQNDCDIKIVNCHDQKNYKKIIKREINSSLYVGISVMTTQVNSALSISDFVKEIDNSIPIVWGGIHPTLFPEQTLSGRSIDTVVVGDGEDSSLKLVNNFKKGVLYSENFWMDELEKIRWNLLPKETIKKIKKNKGVYIHTSRGCPYRCTFCINTVLNNKFRYRSAEKVLNDLEDVKKLGVERFKFRDENFFVNINRVEKIMEGMIEKNYGFEWNTTIRVDQFNRLSQDLLNKMVKSGCKFLNFGAESGSQRILNFLKKDITVEETIKANLRCKEAGIIPYFSFIIGLPRETREDLMKTVNLIKKLIRDNPNARIVGPHLFRPYPGGELYQLCLKLGFNEPETLREWDDIIYSSISTLPWIDSRELIETLSYTAFWTNGLKRALSEKSTTLKFPIFLFYMISKLRWKYNFYRFPIDVKLRNFLSKYKSKI